MCWYARQSSNPGLDIPNVNTLIINRADTLGPLPALPAARARRPKRAAGVLLPPGCRRRAA